MRSLLFILVSLFCTLSSKGQTTIPSLVYQGKSPAGLVGNGKYLIRTTSNSFAAVRGVESNGVLKLKSKGASVDVSKLVWSSMFFPGGVEYSAVVSGGVIRVLYGVDTESGYSVALEYPISFDAELITTGDLVLHVQKNQHKGRVLKIYAEKSDKSATSYDSMKQRLYEPYTKKLIVETPDTTLNKAVLFSQYLLDLSFNGEIMLCELFRWLDTWARDLGSGLLPGGLTSGRVEMARMSLEYDLKRYALMNPKDCKNSNDPSQGGTSSGIGWTARSIWKYYLHSADRKALAADAAVIRPWVEHWTQRDYDQDGLIIDVTEFMDHMIMMLTTNGVTTLAANSMYAGLLYNFSVIEAELGNTKAAANLRKLYDRTVNAINTTYWNQEKGYFNNMTLWDVVSERSSQASQSMLLKIGATDPVRARKTLEYLKNNNWNDYGSITILPKMNHVPLKNDQNVKVWPWWNLWEAEARFKYDDKQGGYHLLRLAASTIKDEKYPGLLEETLALDGTTYGGNAFPTGAGNMLDVTIKDLMGVEPLKAGWQTLKVVPSVPDSWSKYSCAIPSPHGTVSLTYADNQLTIVVNDPNVKVVKTTANAVVKGAIKELYEQPAVMVAQYQKPQKLSAPSIEGGKAMLFYDREFHSQKAELDLETLDVNQLADLNTDMCKKLIIPSSALPLMSKDGKSIRAAIERFTAQGGTVIIYGATTNAKCDEDGAGILGEQGGLIDWYQYLPARDKQMFDSGKNVNMVYTTHVTLPLRFAGNDLYLEVGQLLGLDTVFVNGVFVGHYRDMAPHMKQQYPTKTTYPHSHAYKRVSRMYTITPSDKAYGTLKFGAENLVEIRIAKDALSEGLTAKNMPNIGILTGHNEWQPLDEDIPDMAFSVPKRKGVNYWGNEQFFNSWSTQNGLFGFQIDGRGLDFPDRSRFDGLSNSVTEVQTAYTDFAIFAPWIFEPLAYTTTSEKLLYPMEQERYPCVARIVNTETNGGFILITPSLAHTAQGVELLKRLKIEFTK